MRAHSIGLAIIAAALPNSQTVGQEREENAVFINQAPSAEDAAATRVYHGAVEPVASVSAKASVEEQQVPDTGDGFALTQLSNESAEGSSRATQLTREEGRRVLAQLTAADRQVLLRAVEGTDICNKQPTLPVVIELCLQRLENRSEDFATANAARLSPEERLLGEGLDSDRVATLDKAVSRLAMGRPDFDSDEDQAVASVALSQGALTAEPATRDKEDASDLPAETQALINAIVQQFSNPSGGL